MVTKTTLCVTLSFIFEERKIGHLEQKMTMVRSCLLISVLRDVPFFCRIRE